jgi:hypothetical protein
MDRESQQGGVLRSCERLVQDSTCMIQIDVPRVSRHSDPLAMWRHIIEKHPFYETNAMSFAEELTILPPFSPGDARLPDLAHTMAGRYVMQQKSNPHKTDIDGDIANQPSLDSASSSSGSKEDKPSFTPPDGAKQKLQMMREMLHQEALRESSIWIAEHEISP